MADFVCGLSAILVLCAMIFLMWRTIVTVRRIEINREAKKLFDLMKIETLKSVLEERRKNR